MAMTELTGQAASVLIVRDDPFEVLMVQRRNSGQYASAFVFPGGVVDPDDRSEAWSAWTQGGDALDADDRAFRIAAVRETWEEVGLTIALEGGSAQRSQATRAGHPDFVSLVQQNQLHINLDEMRFFGRWITPIDMPKRWDTLFLLTPLTSSEEPVIDGEEIIGHEWITPRRALQWHESGERQYLYPTLLNLRRLAEADSVQDALERSASHPRVTALVTAERNAEGTWRSVPIEAGYGADRHWTPTSG